GDGRGAGPAVRLVRPGARRQADGVPAPRGDTPGAGAARLGEADRGERLPLPAGEPWGAAGGGGGGRRLPPARGGAPGAGAGGGGGGGGGRAGAPPSPRRRRRPRRHPTAQAEFHGLRAFRSGDSPRWIHWRTSARCGELMVREFEDVPPDHLVLVVEPVAGDG